MTYAKGDFIDLQIEKLSYGGAGIARLENLVVFVPNTAPGDQIKAEVTKVKKRYLEAKLIEIFTEGKVRRKAPCPVAEDCGGCQWQHIDYQEQLKQKESILREMVKRSKVLKDTHILPPLFGEEFRYRNRIQVRNNGKEIGFFQKKTNTIIAIDDCLIAEKPLIRKFEDILKENTSKKMVKTEIYRTEKAQVKYHSNRYHGANDGFAQVNEAMNHKMLQWLNEKVDSLEGSAFYDLYAGNGNFSRYLEAESFAGSITAVEWNEAAVRLGKELANENSKIKWHQTSVENFIESHSFEENDIVLIDPPRVGCDPKLIKAIGASNLKQLLYISCNPTTFIRDIESLHEMKAFNLSEIQALDMFPQTYHIELMAHLKFP